MGRGSQILKNTCTHTILKKQENIKEKMKPRDEKEMEQALLDTRWSREASLQRLPFQDKPEFSESARRCRSRTSQAY